MADLVDRGATPGEGVNDFRFLLEIDRETNVAVLGFVDGLAFHRERAAAVGRARSWAALVDGGGYLTRAAGEAFAAEVTRLLRSRVESIAAAAEFAEHRQYEGEPSVGIEVPTKFETAESYGSWLDRIGWPIVATLINISDPGTFKCPYVFDALVPG